jgi:hypothetical protein
VAQGDSMLVQSGSSARKVRAEKGGKYGFRDWHEISACASKNATIHPGSKNSKFANCNGDKSAKYAHKSYKCATVATSCTNSSKEQSFSESQKFENIFAIAKRLVQQTSMAGAGASILFICLRTMTRSYTSSYSTSSFSLMSRGNFSFFLCPNLRGAFCLRFSRRMAVFALFCVGQMGLVTRRAVWLCMLEFNNLTMI